MAFALLSNTVKQCAAGAPNSATTSAIDTRGASLLVVAVGDYDLSTASTLSDSKTNSWQLVGTQNLGSGLGRLRMFYAYTPIVDAAHTFTISGTAIYGAVAVQAFSGALATSSVFDSQNGNIQHGGSAVGTGNVTPSVNNELISSCAGPHNGSGTSISGTGGTPIQTDTTALIGGQAFCVSMGYEVQTTAATLSHTYSDGSGDNAAIIACFKAAPSGRPVVFTAM